MRHPISHCHNPLPSRPRAGRILIIRLGAMGDVVRTLPALRALRAGYPDAHISWLVERGAEGLLRERPELDRVLRFPREELTLALRGFRLGDFWRELSQFSSILRNERFDVVIDFHSILKSGLLSWLTGARQRISYAPPFSREWSWLFANQRARLSPDKMSRYERNLGLLRFMDLPTHVQGPPMRVRPGARERIADALQGREMSVLIHPGSSGGATYKRYPASKYAELARALRRERGITSMVTLGASEEERELAREIVAMSEEAAVLAPETLDLADLTALIGAARVFVGSDSGPLHIATSLGTPAVQILGPTDPIENEPRKGAPWRQVRVPVACSPCRRGCAQATCMSVIPVEMVLGATVDLLGAVPDRRRSAAVARVSPNSHPVASSWS